MALVKTLDTHTTCIVWRCSQLIKGRKHQVHSILNVDTINILPIEEHNKQYLCSRNYNREDMKQVRQKAIILYSERIKTNSKIRIIISRMSLKFNSKVER